MRSEVPGWLVKPSTGYAFLAIQRFSDAFAARLAARPLVAPAATGPAFDSQRCLTGSFSRSSPSARRRHPPFSPACFGGSNRMHSSGSSPIRRRHATSSRSSGPCRRALPASSRRIRVDLAQTMTAAAAWLEPALKAHLRLAALGTVACTTLWLASLAGGAWLETAILVVLVCVLGLAHGALDFIAGRAVFRRRFRHALADRIWCLLCGPGRPGIRGAG